MTDWQPIETAPTNCYLLLRFDDGRMDVGFCGQGDKQWAFSDPIKNRTVDFEIDPTHWMPLPPPPS